MAVIEIEKADLESLVGKKLTEKDYKERIPMIGCPLEKMDNKKVWYEIFPNRPDMLAVEGFARAVRHFFGISKPNLAYPVDFMKAEIIVDSSVKTVRPEICAAILKNVQLTDSLIASLMQAQEKIHETFGRKRTKVAIGVHDVSNIVWPLRYKAVPPSTVSFIPLNSEKQMNLYEICKQHPKGIEYGWILKKSNFWPVIFDAKDRVISFPPIINSNLTKVKEDTKNILVEVTGMHPLATKLALNILVTAIYERGCKIEAVKIGEKWTPDLEPKKMKIDIGYVNKLLDLDIKEWELKPVLQKMGLEWEDGHVLIPPYRADIMHEIDIVEDIAIGWGYERFEPKLPHIQTIAKRDERNEIIAFLKEILIGFGLQEVTGMILTNEKSEFKMMERSESKTCQTANPLSSECTICRKSILPSLLKVLSQNRHYPFPQNIFEIGDVLIPDKEIMQRKKLAVAISDERINYYQIANILSSFMKNIGIEYEIRETKDSSFIKGRTGAIFIFKTQIGLIGEINPAVLENWKICTPVAAFEIDLEKIIDYLASQPKIL
ncbi:MAG: phenylalanine--tRNA ligase subunit beta [Candidatus Aenigmatarchaeota archaeon]